MNQSRIKKIKKAALNAVNESGLKSKEAADMYMKTVKALKAARKKRSLAAKMPASLPKTKAHAGESDAAFAKRRAKSNFKRRAREKRGNVC